MTNIIHLVSDRQTLVTMLDAGDKGVQTGRGSWPYGAYFIEHIENLHKKYPSEHNGYKERKGNRE